MQPRCSDWLWWINHPALCKSLLGRFFVIGQSGQTISSRGEAVLATEDIRSQIGSLKELHLVFRCGMPSSLEGERLRGERFRSLAQVLEA